MNIIQRIGPGSFIFYIHFEWFCIKFVGAQHRYFYHSIFGGVCNAFDINNVLVSYRQAQTEAAGCIRYATDRFLRRHPFKKDLFSFRRFSFHVCDNDIDFCCRGIVLRKGADKEDCCKQRQCGPSHSEALRIPERKWVCFIVSNR